MTDAFASAVVDPVAELVGDGKKFATVADLAKGKLEADQFIENLKKEQAELRKELNARVDTDRTLEELRAEFKALKETRSAALAPEKTPQSVSEDALKTLIAKTITEQEATKTAAQNIVSANNELVRHYGSVEKAQEALRTKAAELGLSIDSLKQTASQSPTAFLRLVMPEAVKSNAGDFASTVRTDGLPIVAGGAPKEGTKEFFDAIRDKNPKRYWSPEVQNAIHKAAMAGTYDYRAGLSNN